MARFMTSQPDSGCFEAISFNVRCYQSSSITSTTSEGNSLKECMVGLGRTILLAAEEGPKIRKNVIEIMSVNF